MGSKLPKTGVQAVVEGLPSFNKAMDFVFEKIAGIGKSTKEATQYVNPFSKALDKAGVSVGGFRFQLDDLLKSAGPVGDFFSTMIDKIGALPLPATLAIAGIVGLGKAFIDLGVRGSTLIGLAQTFDNVSSSVGVASQSLLIDLRKASAGTISDFKLIEKANVALSGATGKLGEELGAKLPRLLEIARVQARATGKDIDYIFNSLVEGVRKSSPLRIDNAQLIIKVTAAEEAYAESIGKTVEQLTVEEKGIAILNATLEAGNKALAQAGNVQETTAEKIARAQATVANILDSFAIAVQPAFGTVLDAVQSVLNIFQQLGNAVAPIFGGILSIIANVFSTIVSIITAIAQPIIDAFSSIAPYIALVFQFIGKIVSGIGKVISDVVGGIVKFLSDVGKQFFGLDLKNLGPQLFNGAAAAFGSFANGIIAVANKLIFPAVIGIAQFIADFLIGFSPPKMGPLSQIDEGGANVMESWLSGFSGVSLDPVEQVAQEVSTALGTIGKQSLNVVNKRLAQLDKALVPFQNRLDIIKANFDALQQPAQLALDAIDRETAKLQDAVAQGDPAAAERLRLLDQQRDAIQGQVDAQQSLVDRAQIQLALAKAQQAPERALLTIRQKLLEALQKKTVKPAAGNTGVVDTSPTGTGTSAPLPAEAGAGAGVAPGTFPSVLDMIGGQGAVDAAAQGLSDAFMGAIDQSGLEEFAQNSLDLGAQIDRIKSVDLGSKIADKFQGLTDAFNPEVDGSPANMVQNFVMTLTGPADMPGSIASFFANLPQNVSDAASGLWESLQTNVFDPVKNFLIGDGPGTMNDILNQFINLFAQMPALLVDALRNFAGMVYNAIVVPIINVLNAGIGAVESAVRSIAGFFAGMLGEIIGGFDNAEIAGTNLGGLVPQSLRDFQANLDSIGHNFTIGRISTALPAFLQPPGGATGGIFSSGLMRVGERGPELMYNATKMGVLPNQLVSVLGDLSRVLAQPQPLPVAAGNTFNSSDSMVNNFYGVQGSNDVMRKMASLRARR